jgi:hypothetical protein
MKTLPDAPNLDHLRQQAKDVLLQMRGVRPEASLSEAQVLIAERYGFHTWPDLKAEVDRRAARVVEADVETTAAVASAFDLGRPAGPMLGLGRQWAGPAWVLTTERGRWLARELFRWFEDAALEPEVLLAESATAAGILTPRPVRSPSGRIVETVAEARWRVYSLPAVGPEPTLPADPRHANAAGRIVGTVHAMGLPAPAPVSCWLTNVRPEWKWRDLHAAAAAAGKPWLCASMSWLASRIRIALTEPDDEQRELADRSVPWLLKDPPTRSKYKAVLDAVV